MFIGLYYHNLEDKGRLSLPKPFRAQTKNWIVTRGLDGGLFVFKKEDFEQKIAELAERTFTKKHNRDFIRLMVNEAKEIEPDKNGRVQLPEYLIEYAALEKEVVVVGSFTHLEIWDRDRYHKYVDSLEENAEAIAEKLTDEPDR
ncbi:MAG TPA: division/cell wall cluster transcriptional repressor MraZ [Patescibacteria group bacterium]